MTNARVFHNNEIHNNERTPQYLTTIFNCDITEYPALGFMSSAYCTPYRIDFKAVSSAKI